MNKKVADAKTDTVHNTTNSTHEEAGPKSGSAFVTPRVLRADAQRSEDAVLAAALAVFATSGVDAPAREIAEKAGVGLGTLYRRFPKRSDLIVGVFCQQVDACAAAAAVFAAECGPGEALARWAQRYADFITTKRGLATALHSGDPAFEDLPRYFEKHLIPALQTLLVAAAAAGEICVDDIIAYDLLRAIGGLCLAAQGDGMAYARRMVDLLINGLRYRTTA